MASLVWDQSHGELGAMISVLPRIETGVAVMFAVQNWRLGSVVAFRQLAAHVLAVDFAGDICCSVSLSMVPYEASCISGVCRTTSDTSLTFSVSLAAAREARQPNAEAEDLSFAFMQRGRWADGNADGAPSTPHPPPAWGSAQQPPPPSPPGRNLNAWREWDAAPQEPPQQNGWQSYQAELAGPRGFYPSADALLRPSGGHLDYPVVPAACPSVAASHSACSAGPQLPTVTRRRCC